MSDRNIQKILITGITGSGGSYLADYIMEYHPTVEIHGLSRWHSTSSSKNLSSCQNHISVHECDLNDFSSIFTILKDVKPDAIFHLASHANVRTSFITPLSVIQNNIMGTATLFEAVRATNIDPIIQHCSTSECYGQVDPKEIPIKETCALNPSSPYAVSKVAQDLLGFTYFRNYKMKIVRTRMFAYLNPRRHDLFATSFARQVAKIEQGLQKTLYHGNLDSVRTLIDVRDAMAAYWAATIKGHYGEVYNIGGNKVITVGNFLDVLKSLAHTSIPTMLDPKLLRPSDVTLQIPNCSKFVSETGWETKYSFEESVHFLLEQCRRDIAQENSNTL